MDEEEKISQSRAEMKVMNSLKKVFALVGQLEEAWIKHLEEVRELPLIVRENLPLTAQEILAAEYNWWDFEMAMPNLTLQYAMNGRREWLDRILLDLGVTKPRREEKDG